MAPEEGPTIIVGLVKWLAFLASWGVVRGVCIPPPCVVVFSATTDGGGGHIIITLSRVICHIIDLAHNFSPLLLSSHLPLFKGRFFNDDIPMDGHHVCHNHCCYFFGSMIMMRCVMWITRCLMNAQPFSRRGHLESICIQMPLCVCVWGCLQHPHPPPNDGSWKGTQKGWTLSSFFGYFVCLLAQSRKRWFCQAKKKGGEDNKDAHLCVIVVFCACRPIIDDDDVPTTV